MKILITTAFVDPEAVGEPRWCYDLAKGLSERVETVIISQSPLRKGARVADFFPNATVYEDDGWELKFLDKRMKALIKPNYLKYHAFAQKVIRTQLQGAGITCGHHFGPLGMRYPTPLRNSGIPYIVGPIGGSLKFPEGFDNPDTKDPWYYKFRDLDSLRFRYDPALRASYQKAEYIVGAGRYVEEVLKDLSINRFVAHSQRVARTPVDDIEAVLQRRVERGGPLRLMVASRLIYSKGIHYALRAIAKASDRLPAWQLDILGDGTYREKLQNLATELGIADKVTFHGHVPHATVDSFYRDADIFLFPTIREPSGAVIFESIRWGVPLIAADYGGPATHVQDSFGVRVPVTSPQTMIDGMADALVQLGGSAELRLAMGREGLRAAREKHSMPAMVDFFLGLYSEVEARHRPVDRLLAG